MRFAKRIIGPLTFVCLAVVVDWFLVPHFESGGMGWFTAIFAGSCMAAVGAWALLFGCYQVVRLFKKVLPKKTRHEL